MNSRLLTLGRLHTGGAPSCVLFKGILFAEQWGSSRPEGAERRLLAEAQLFVEAAGGRRDQSGLQLRGSLGVCAKQLPGPLLSPQALRAELCGLWLGRPWCPSAGPAACGPRGQRLTRCSLVQSLFARGSWPPPAELWFFLGTNPKVTWLFGPAGASRFLFLTEG